MGGSSRLSETVWSRDIRPQGRSEAIMLLRAADTNKDGFVDLAEFSEVIHLIDPRKSKSEVAAMYFDAVSITLCFSCSLSSWRLSFS